MKLSIAFTFAVCLLVFTILGIGFYYGLEVGKSSCVQVKDDFLIEGVCVDIKNTGE